MGEDTILVEVPASDNADIGLVVLVKVGGQWKAKYKVSYLGLGSEKVEFEDADGDTKVISQQDLVNTLMYLEQYDSREVHEAEVLERVEDLVESIRAELQ